MTSGIVRSALSYILTDSTFSGTPERSKKSLQQIATLLNAVAKGNYCDIFDDFSIRLLTHLQSLLSTSQLHDSVTRKREQLWSIFHQKRTADIARMWKTCLQSMQLELDPLAYQAVTQLLYEDKIKAQAASESTTTTKSNSFLITLTHEEECIICYAAGYVPFASLKNMKNVYQKAVQFSLSNA